MADIKTNLRELSVIVGIYKEINDTDYLNTPKSFIEICNAALPKELASAYENVTCLRAFDEEQNQIITNGFNLAQAIIEKFNIGTIDELNWYGYIANKDEPYDITVNDIKFSLKEESFILENMGLYKLLNCFTGSSYKRRHIFKDYAPDEYAKWFSVTWKEMLKYFSAEKNAWHYQNPLKPKSSYIRITPKGVELEFYENDALRAKSILPLKCDLATFMSKTKVKTREEVFAKFINQILEKNSAYSKIKKRCAVVASNALAKELTQNLNYDAGLPRFLRIHESEYFYAKTTTESVTIYKVPSRADFADNIEIVSIVGSVPENQANILTTIRNKNTGRELVLRNECRFSHGQFNGTPEAKLYYDSGGSLLVIYEDI